MKVFSEEQLNQNHLFVSTQNLEPILAETLAGTQSSSLIYS